MYGHRITDIDMRETVVLPFTLLSAAGMRISGVKVSHVLGCEIETEIDWENYESHQLHICLTLSHDWGCCGT